MTDMKTERFRRRRYRCSGSKTVTKLSVAMGAWPKEYYTAWAEKCLVTSDTECYCMYDLKN